MGGIIAILSAALLCSQPIALKPHMSEACGSHLIHTRVLWERWTPQRQLPVCSLLFSFYLFFCPLQPVFFETRTHNFFLVDVFTLPPAYNKKKTNKCNKCRRSEKSRLRRECFIFSPSPSAPSVCRRWSAKTAAHTTWRWVTTWPAAKLSTSPPWWWRPWVFTALTGCCRTSGSTPRWSRRSWCPWRCGCRCRASTCNWKQVSEADGRVGPGTQLTVKKNLENSSFVGAKFRYPRK